MSCINKKIWLLEHDISYENRTFLNLLHKHFGITIQFDRDFPISNQVFRIFNHGFERNRDRDRKIFGRFEQRLASSFDFSEFVFDVVGYGECSGMVDKIVEHKNRTIKDVVERDGIVTAAFLALKYGQNLL